MTRRSFLTALAAVGGSGAFFNTPGLYAEAAQKSLVMTPRQTEGPFYPDKLPLDTDNDLLIINDSLTPATGEIAHLSGRILDGRGDPIRNAVVEIWQVDNNGVYLHSRSAKRGKRDENFQGFGRFMTSSTGEYYFRTIKPTPYPGRTPHIHVRVQKNGKKLLSTQAYVKGHAMNKRDGLLNRIRDPKQRASVILDYKKVPGSPVAESAATFDIVVGWTPKDPEE